MAPGITVIGLGPGDLQLLTRAAWSLLQSTHEVYLRTSRHPLTADLPDQLAVHSFDDVYDRHASFEEVYDVILARLLALGARPEGVIYAVPGDPSLGEATVQRLRRSAPAAGLPLEVVPGVSFIEPCLDLLGVDGVEGLFVADALELAAQHHPPFPPDRHAFVAQVFSRLLASDVKLTLANQYPEDHPVVLVHAAGTPSAALERLPLYEIDHSPSLDVLTTLYVPPLDGPASFEALQDTIARLRAPDGCPWDREQTHDSLRTHLLEETYEAIEAIDRGDFKGLQEELGDLLLQIVLQGQIATEADEFSMAAVIASVNRKLVERHPHVFGEVEVAGVGEVLHNWEALKARERSERGEGDRSALGGVPRALPALAQAYEYQKRAASVGFDWPDVSGVVAKVAEEVAELSAAPDGPSLGRELGDLLFAVVNFARWRMIDPEAALRQANQRFRTRFHYVEQKASALGRSMAQMSLAQLDELWEDAKRAGNGS